MHTKSCVCEGSNENCRWCGGSGIVAAENDEQPNTILESAVVSSDAVLRTNTVIDHGSPITHRLPHFENVDVKAVIVPAEAPSARTKLKYIGRPDHRTSDEIDELIKGGAILLDGDRGSRCKFCRKIVGADISRKHLAACVRVPKWITVPDDKPERPPKLPPARPVFRKSLLKQICPLCKSEFRFSSELRAHREKGLCVRAVPKSEVSQPKRRSSRLASVQWTTCIRCGTKLKRNHIQRHTEKCPMRFTATTKTKGSDKTKKLQPTRTPSPEPIWPPATASTRLTDHRKKQALGRDPYDATRDYAYPCRESGKYGSHPLHDDFSDEGTPD